MGNKLAGNLWTNCFYEPRRKNIQADKEISLIFIPVFPFFFLMDPVFHDYLLCHAKFCDQAVSWRNFYFFFNIGKRGKKLTAVFIYAH